EWVLAVWVKRGFTSANADSTLRETGYYRDPADTSQPGVVDVLTQPATSIDFVIDFGQMHPPCRYYTPPCPSDSRPPPPSCWSRARSARSRRPCTARFVTSRRASASATR